MLSKIKKNLMLKLFKTLTHRKMMKQYKNRQQKKFNLKNLDPLRNRSWRRKLGGNQYRAPMALIDSHETQAAIQERGTYTRANYNGDESVIFFSLTVSQLGKTLVRDDNTSNFLTLSSTVVLKLKKRRLFVPLIFDSVPRLDAVFDLRACVSTIADIELNRIKKGAPSKSFKNEIFSFF